MKVLEIIDSLTEHISWKRAWLMELINDYLSYYIV